MSPFRSLLLASLCLLNACAVQPREALPPLEFPGSRFAEPESNGPLVGLALSGGGSRAATFAAAVMEELARLPLARDSSRSVLGSVRYISGVSGGSLAAAYFGMLKPPREQPALEEGRLSAPYASFFQSFVTSMQQDFEDAVVRGMLTQSDNRLHSLAAEWDAQFFHGATLSDLHVREARGDSPSLVLNATSLDTGRRFAFTTLPQRSFDFNLIREIIERATPQDLTEEDRLAMQREIGEESQQHLPITFEEIGADPAGFRVSLAVAASSAVPYLIGPLSLEVKRGETVEAHRIVDGGLIDNQGVESLFQLFATKLRARAQGTTGRAMIISIDASFPFFQGAGDGREARLQSLANDALRLTAIMEQSGKTYRSLLWSLIRRGNGSGFPDFRLVTLRHVDAEDAVARNPPSDCVAPQAGDAQSFVRNRLRRIATRYEIGDACDASLLRAAAREIVAANAKRILDFYAD